MNSSDININNELVIYYMQNWWSGEYNTCAWDNLLNLEEEEVTVVDDANPSLAYKHGHIMLKILKISLHKLQGQHCTLVKEH